MLLALEAPFWMAGYWVHFVAAIDKANYKSWNVTAADGDVLFVIPHGFTDNNGAPVAPDYVTVQPLVSVALAALANWGVVQVTATQIILRKQSATGSGGAPAVKVYAMRPHSLIQ